MHSLKELYKIGCGPSSSHTIGPERAATIYKEKHPDAEAFRVVLYGSLSKTGKGHGTDRVLQEVLSPTPTEIVFATEMPADVVHPNTMEFFTVKDGAAENRKILCEKLSLPKDLTAPALLDALNMLYSREAFLNEVLDFS